MTIRNSTIQKFTTAFPNFDVSSQSDCIALKCKCCCEVQTAKVSTLSRRLKHGFKTKCDSYQCRALKVSQEFERLGERNIKCSKCSLEYHMEKDVKYFQCYCSLKIKQTEHEIYKLLKTNGYNKLSRESYWNKQLTNHKCDIVIHHNDQKIFIEVDDKSHYNKDVILKDNTFNQLFKQNRNQNEYLVRIVDGYLGIKEYLNDFIQIIENPDRAEFITL